MTIQISGHVQATDFESSPPGTIAISVYCDSAKCKAPFVIYVPQAQAREWVAGNSVSVTMYAFDPALTGPTP